MSELFSNIGMSSPAPSVARHILHNLTPLMVRLFSKEFTKHAIMNFLFTFSNNTDCS